MKIYFTRHGETEWNSRNIICGVTDIDLSPNGEKQAEALGKRINLERPQIARIITSPMKRAMHTSEIISGITGIPVTDTENALREWDYGTYEGKPRDVPGFKENKVEFGCRMPGGESVFDVVNRVYGFLDECPERYSGENILLVCHGGVCRVIETYYRDITRKEFSEFFMGNCELRDFCV
ncbi:MAG: histidine phosphatase family protein [Oscillospiraceae bacterium]|nr:histidine phosphatase family protein [Oscillospiraceae bacterium]